jgi:methylase of polypeptide subunit release factors
MVSNRIFGNVMVNSSVLKPSACSWNHHARALLRQRYALFPAKLCLKSHTGIDWKEARSMTVSDPCMGSGRFLLGSAGHSLRLYGIDIDAEVVRAAKVNGALYAPWLVRPFPGHFFRPPLELEHTDKSQRSAEATQGVTLQRKPKGAAAVRK